MANDTEYGLSGSIFTRDLGRALRVSRAIESGNLSVNSHSSVRYWTPFGGYKQSGLGSRARSRCAAGLHRGEERLLRRLNSKDQRRAGQHERTDRGPGRGDHRRLFRHRAGQRPPARRGGRHRGDRRPRRDPRSRTGRGTGRRLPAHRRHRRRAGRRRCSPSPHDRFGSVDVAFNNAGISPPEDDSILDTDLDAWRRVQEVNLTSVYLCCRAALPYMLQQQRGSIINTASFVAVMGAATSQISYSASKGGVLSHESRAGRAVRPLRASASTRCVPGRSTPRCCGSCSPPIPRRAARRLVHVPMGRFAEPEEIANAVLFLASDESSLRQREHVPGRRRHLGGLRDAAVMPPAASTGRM